MRECISWTAHAEVRELAGEFRATEYAFALSEELREAAKSPGARIRIAPAEVVPRKTLRGKRPPPKKGAAKEAPAKKAAPKKASAKKKAPAKKRTPAKTEAAKRTPPAR